MSIYSEVSGVAQNLFFGHLVTASGPNIYAASFNGIYRSTNYNAIWSSIDQVWLQPSGLAVSGNALFASVSFGGAYLTTDRAETWTAADTGLDANAAYEPTVVSGNDISIGTDAGTIYRDSLGEMIGGSLVSSESSSAFSIERIAEQST